MNLSPDKLRKEATRRELLAIKASAQLAALRADLFDKELAFIDDPAKRKTLDAGRRSGKTHTFSRDLVKTAHDFAGCECLYASITKPHAVDLLWREILGYCEKNNIETKTDNLRHIITYANGSRTVFGGVNTKAEREKARGFKRRKIILDETGSMGPYLGYFIEDILEYTLLDYGGVLILGGTPAPVSAGAYFDAIHSPDYSHHHWTVADNPKIPQWANDPNWRERARAYLEELRKRTPDAKFRREILGEWVRDVDALLYKLDNEKNHYEHLPDNQDFDYVVGADTGFNDASAIVVLGASRRTNMVYVVHEWEKKGCLIDGLATELKSTLAKFPNASIVIDPANKQLVESMRVLYDLPLELADKMGKSAHIDIMNSSLHNGQLKFPKKSSTYDQMSCLQWNDQHTREREGFPADLSDSCLYAFTHAHQHNFFRPDTFSNPDVPKRTEIEQKLINAAMERSKPKQDELDYDEPSFFGDSDSDF